jgi:hypothetical protein
MHWLLLVQLLVATDMHRLGARYYYQHMRKKRSFTIAEALQKAIR